MSRYVIASLIATVLLGTAAVGCIADTDDVEIDEDVALDPAAGRPLPPGYGENTDALCHDGIDNDGDNKIDQDDSECMGRRILPTPDPEM